MLIKSTIRFATCFFFVEDAREQELNHWNLVLKLINIKYYTLPSLYTRRINIINGYVLYRDNKRPRMHEKKKKKEKNW